MDRLNRRSLFTASARTMLGASALYFCGDAKAAPSPKKPADRAVQKAEWMARWMDSARASDSPLYLGRFRDETYFVLEPITWKPNADQAARFSAVEVPRGFVTDLASIPRIFFSVLRPDGQYAYSAIVHDYLYWTQTRTREESDEIFKLGMQDFDIAKKTVFAVHRAVQTFGASAWKANAELRARGEKRILKEFPPNARTLWADWKTRPEVFASE
jgi:hypothetical protein